MKFVITMKNPDSFEDSIRRAAEESVVQNITNRKEVIEEEYEELKKFASKWVEYDEYVRIEVDTDKGTATVLEV
jgi:hypothetical protein